jgi:hypothetical protein
MGLAFGFGLTGLTRERWKGEIQVRAESADNKKTANRDLASLSWASPGPCHGGAYQRSASL